MLLSAHYWTGCSMAQSAKIAAVGSDCVCVCVCVCVWMGAIPSPPCQDPQAHPLHGSAPWEPQASEFEGS